jgi:hypothetical protein
VYLVVVQGASRGNVVLPGLRVPVDVLRRSLPPHPVGLTVPLREQSGLPPLPDRLADSWCPRYSLRCPQGLPPAGLHSVSLITLFTHSPTFVFILYYNLSYMHLISIL